MVGTLLKPAPDTPQALGLIFRALAFAAQKHSGQRREDAEKTPYINHPLALADVLINEGGITDAETLCAALLHDTLEDTETTAEELRQHFGDNITRLVQEVSDDKSLHWRTRKRLQIEHAPHLSQKAQCIKLADKICNLRDLVVSPPPAWSPKRRREYLEWANTVISAIRAASPALAEQFDRIYAQRMRPDLGY
ncbi:MAG: HD domain-containing protein [Zoogloeaceae bacterium]|jgi:guanosine-3',5'-bis(diphosphate) 3'-pyrophosphohydrolase|nr:HD domain-containing protein [Zoogloeaceae bacterium]